MSPEEYECHRERILWLSEHPLVDRDRADRDTEQTELAEWGAA